MCLYWLSVLTIVVGLYLIVWWPTHHFGDGDARVRCLDFLMPDESAFYGAPMPTVSANSKPIHPDAGGTRGEKSTLMLDGAPHVWRHKLPSEGAAGLSALERLGHRANNCGMCVCACVCPWAEADEVTGA